MNLLENIVLSTFTLLLICTPAGAQGWRGIVPMKSTCEDVKRILGVSTCNPPDEAYDFGAEMVRISFSRYPCYKAYQKFWNVPVGTVVIIERHLKERIPLAELNIDVGKCEKRYTDFTDQVVYICGEEGMELNTIKGEIERIDYMPTSKDAQIQCPIKQPKRRARRAREKSKGAPNNSFNPTGISMAFIRETWRLGSLCSGGLIRALYRFL